MNRTEFMRQLENLLQNISPEERAEALQYYNDYFDDAGAEKEQEVLEALGDPIKVAENIKQDIYASGNGDDSKTIAWDKALVEYGQQPQRNFNENSWADTTDYTPSVQKKEGLPTWVIILIVLACVCLAPAFLGVGAGVLGTLFCILIAWFACIFAFGLTVVVMFAVAVGLVIAAVLCLGTSPLVSLAVFAVALICLGVGILFMMLTVAMAGIATPAIFKGIAALFRKIFGKREVRE